MLQADACLMNKSNITFSKTTSRPADIFIEMFIPRRWVSAPSPETILVEEKGETFSYAIVFSLHISSSDITNIVKRRQFILMFGRASMLFPELSDILSMQSSLLEPHIQQSPKTSSKVLEESLISQLEVIDSY